MLLKKTTFFNSKCETDFFQRKQPTLKKTAFKKKETAGGIRGKFCETKLPRGGKRNKRARREVDYEGFEDLMMPPLILIKNE